MGSTTCGRAVAASALLALFALPQPAAGGGPPLQAAFEILVDDAGDKTAAATLDGGTAKVRARVVSRDDSRTAAITLRFAYTIPPDTIAFDEIIDRVVVRTESPAGDPIGETTMDPNEVNLNPNGPTLRYRLTMYRPDGDYRVRIEIYGNYE